MQTKSSSSLISIKQKKASLLKELILKQKQKSHQNNQMEMKSLTKMQQNVSKTSSIAQINTETTDKKKLIIQLNHSNIISKKSVNHT